METPPSDRPARRRRRAHHRAGRPLGRAAARRTCATDRAALLPRRARASSTQRIYGIDIANLDVMYGGIAAEGHARRTWASRAPWACRSSASSPADERERHTILDAPQLGDGRPRAPRLQHADTVCRAPSSSRPSCSPGGTFLPHIAPAVCQVYNDWILNDYCARLGRPADPGRGAADRSTSTPRSPRCSAPPSWASRPSSSAPTRCTARSTPTASFDPLWQAIVDTGHEARPPPAADVGPGRHVEAATGCPTSWRRRASASRWT